MTEHLIHIGFPKTGSKFLQRWFAEHPDIVFDPIGIGGCRDIYELVRQAGAPGRRIGCRVTSFEGLVTPDLRAGLLRADEEWEGRRSDGEAQQRTCATLAALFPRARILLVTRGFRSMLLSGYSQYVRSGGGRDFHVFGPPDPAAAERGRQAWDYDAVIGLYRAAFGDRLIVLPCELLRDDPTAFTAELERRLGLGHFAPAPQPVNPSLSPEGLRWYPRLTRLIRRLPLGAPLRKALLRLYVPRIGGRRLEAVVQRLQRLRPVAPVTPELITDEMLEGFRGKAERLRGNAFYEPYRQEYLL